MLLPSLLGPKICVLFPNGGTIKNQITTEVPEGALDKIDRRGPTGAGPTASAEGSPRQRAKYGSGEQQRKTQRHYADRGLGESPTGPRGNCPPQARKRETPHHNQRKTQAIRSKQTYSTPIDGA